MCYSLWQKINFFVGLCMLPSCLLERGDCASLPVIVQLQCWWDYCAWSDAGWVLREKIERSHRFFFMDTAYAILRLDRMKGAGQVDWFKDVLSPLSFQPFWPFCIVLRDMLVISRRAAIKDACVPVKDLLVPTTDKRKVSINIPFCVEPTKVRWNITV